MVSLGEKMKDDIPELTQSVATVDNVTIVILNQDILNVQQIEINLVNYSFTFYCHHIHLSTS